MCVLVYIERLLEYAMNRQYALNFGKYLGLKQGN